jgi:hypothetical protein
LSGEAVSQAQAAPPPLVLGVTDNRRSPKARLQAHLEAGERTSASRLAEAELKIRERFGLLADTPPHDVTIRGSPLL